MKTIYLDMDGTFYNLYGINGWLEELLNESKNIFTKGQCLYNINELKNALAKVKEKYNLGIITWTPRKCRKTYIGNTAKQKYKWLRQNELINYFNEIKIVSYGTEKYTLMGENDILIDDDKRNIEKCNEYGKNGILTNGKDLIKILENI